MKFTYIVHSIGPVMQQGGTSAKGPTSVCELGETQLWGTSWWITVVAEQLEGGEGWLLLASCTPSLSWKPGSDLPCTDVQQWTNTRCMSLLESPLCSYRWCRHRVLEQAWQTMVLHLFLSMKFYWNTAMIICYVSPVAAFMLQWQKWVIS